MDEQIKKVPCIRVADFVYVQALAVEALLHDLAEDTDDDFAAERLHAVAEMIGGSTFSEKA